MASPSAAHATASSVIDLRFGQVFEEVIVRDGSAVHAAINAGQEPLLTDTAHAGA